MILNITTKPIQYFLFFHLTLQLLIQIVLCVILLIQFGADGKPTESSLSTEPVKHDSVEQNAFHAVQQIPLNPSETTTESTPVNVLCKQYKSNNTVKCRNGRRVNCRSRQLITKPTKVYIQMPNMFISQSWGPGR